MLDTTYLFPLAGIDIQSVERETIIVAKEIGHQLSISEISLFELAAKGARLVRDGSADPERVAQAVKAIASDEKLSKVRLHENEVLSLAMELRRHHSDFIDCLILASAVTTCEVLVTDDEVLSHNTELMKLARKARPEFSVCTSRRLLAGGK